MIEACIFDIGGVLIKTDEAVLSAVESSLKENNLPTPPASKIMLYFGTSFYTVIKMAAASVYKGSNSNAVADSCYNSFQAIYPAKVLDKHRIFPDTENCLRELHRRGIITACQTGDTLKQAHLLLNHFNLMKYFPVIVTVDDVKKPRPDPEAMYLTMKKLKIADKSKCLYVGDTINDIRFAQNLGVKIACVTTGAQKRETLEKEKPDYLIDNLMEILNII